MVTAADEARRRIERDLHDGAQQRIVSLALELRMAAESVPAEQSAVRQLLSHSVQGLTEVHEGLRDLARGIHPVQLSQGGICPVLRTLARRSTVPVELDLHIGRSLPERVEVAVYFVVSEALTNAAKHSQASVVHVTVETDTSAIRLSVHDDGTGGADVSEGTGLMGLRDRVEALGGRLNIVSPPGQGTTLTAEIPIDDVDMADLVPPGAERRRKSV
ncbi:sensor histidine kinase [Dactylosporangium fulvum]|uniref:sensor histidine kinase n=1 Tax=Dactylosporangium fulvum TaxID=53359 RepID=UPI003CD08381